MEGTKRHRSSIEGGRKIPDGTGATPSHHHFRTLERIEEDTWTPDRTRQKEKKHTWSPPDGDKYKQYIRRDRGRLDLDKQGAH